MERSGTGAPYPQGAGFAKLLGWHLDHGTRPDGRPERHGKRWSNKTFATACTPDGAIEATQERTVSHWRNGSRRPDDIDTICRALFGGTSAYDAWRADLIDAHARLFAKTGPEPARIPPKPAHFLGRDADVATLGAALLAADNVALLVRGGPGIGKTSLTKAVGNAPDIAKRFGEARWFVALETAPGAVALQDALARALGLDPKEGFQATLAALRARPGLIVLDNLETPWERGEEREATHETLARLADIPGLCLLASFRGQAPIGGAAWCPHPLEGLAAPDATALFRRIAPEIGEDDPNLPGLIAAFGGIPLAIELVAKQNLGRPTLTALRKRWDAVGAALAADKEAAPGRLSSLPHSIEVSLGSPRMTTEALRLFRLLGQVPAGLCEEDRDALLGEAGFDADNLLRGLGLAFGRDNRLDLLPPIRDHARRHRKPAATDERAWPRHYLTLTRERGEAIGTTAGTGAVARLMPEFPNIDAAIRAVLVAGRREEAMAALHGFGRFTYIAGLPAPVLEDLAAACRVDGDGRGEAGCIQSLGNIALARSNHEAARAAYQAALPLYRQAGFVQGEAHCIEWLGDIALARSEYAVARSAYEAAMLLYRQVGGVLGEANCTKSLGNIALERSDHVAARAAFEAALLLYRQVGSVLGEANCIRNLGDIALRRSDHEAARGAFEAALPLYRQVGSVLGEANCIVSLGAIALRRSDHEAAGKAFEAALLLYRPVGNRLGEANCTFSLGNIALKRSDHEAARDAFEAALQLYRQVGAVLGKANCIKCLGEIALKRSDHEVARDAYEAALSLYRQVGSVLGEANCIQGFGDCAAAREEPGAARARYEEALALYRRIGDRDSERECQEKLDRLSGG